MFDVPINYCTHKKYVCTVVLSTTVEIYKVILYIIKYSFTICEI